MIFQVRADTVYLIDDHNKVILPDQGGAFDNLELLGGGPYEVYGESTNDGEPGEGPHLPPTSKLLTALLFAAHSVLVVPLVQQLFRLQKQLDQRCYKGMFL
uniref:Uncharacterized protein n=1 Tax=Knipowitschia caucasica TaxID=637954 RepID=A0AAV2KXA3_KNICA